jgi:hypothetical protein
MPWGKDFAGYTSSSIFATLLKLSITRTAGFLPVI